MKILAIETDSADRDNVASSSELLAAEARRAWELVQAGVIRELYFLADRPNAVLLLECRDAEEAGKILGTLPLVAAGRIQFDLYPLVPYPGFERLFTQQ